MKTQNISILATAVFIYTLTGHALAAVGAGHDCPLTKPSAGAGPTAQVTTPAPSHTDAHMASAMPVEADADLSSAIRMIMKNEKSCMANASGGRCPLSGSLLFRHGSCCADECRRAPSPNELQAAGALGATGVTWLRPTYQQPLTLCHFTNSIIQPAASLHISPDPRPPSF